MQTATPAPLVLESGQGRALWHLGALLVFKALGEETGGQYWALEGLADNTMAVPLHAHSLEAEIWYVLEGEIAFTIRNATTLAGVGAFAYIPPNVPHTFHIRSGIARCFGIGIPTGLDKWFFETGVPAHSLFLPPPPEGPPDVDTIVTSLQKYGMATLGPPPNNAGQAPLKS